MMANVDENVVSLKFTNFDFKSKVAETLKSIQDLKSNLKFDKLDKTFSGISESAAKIGDAFEAPKSALQAFADKFIDVRQIITMNVTRLATTVMTSVGGMVKSFTFDPITDGLREYETQLNSVQTILANTQSKGENISTVNEALAELNKYSDDTIYNFSEMARNIGTFTAAGVGLKDSVTSIKGIANLAALSGSNSQQASTAMYQLSQAMSAGTVKLMDWNSVVNAGMGGEVFQEALKRTARAMGTNVDYLIEKNGSFRESLQEGWITSEVMVKTLSTMTGDLSTVQLEAMGYTREQAEEIERLAKTAVDAATKYKTFSALMGGVKEALGSGWATTWQILIGNFEEAQSLWSGIGNAVTGFVGNFSDARNRVLQDWKVMGGRSELLTTLKNLFTILITPVKIISTAFKEIFNSSPAESMYKMTKAMANLTSKFILSESATKNLVSVFKALFSAVKFVLNVFTQAAKLVLSILIPPIALTYKIVTYLIGKILNLVGSISELNVKFWSFAAAIKPVDYLIEKLIPSMANAFKNAAKWASEQDILNKIWQFAGPKLKTLAKNTKEYAKALIESNPKLSEFIEKGKGFSEFVKMEGASVKTFAKNIYAALPTVDELKAKLQSAAEKLGVFGEKANLLKDGAASRFKGFVLVLEEVRASIVSAYQKMAAEISEIATRTYTSFVETLGGIKDAVGNFTVSLFTDFYGYVARSWSNVKSAALVVKNSSIWSTIGDGAVSAFDGLKRGLSYMAKTDMFAKIVSGLKTFGSWLKTSTAKIWEFGKKVDWIKALTDVSWVGARVGIVAFLMNLSKGIKGITDLVGKFSEVGGELSSGIQRISKASARDKNASAILKMAAALLVLAVAVTLLARIPAEDLLKGTLAVTALVGVLKSLDVVANSLKVSGLGSIARMAVTLLMVAAVAKLAEAVARLGALDTMQLVKGVAAVTILSLALIAMVKVSDESDKVLNKGQKLAKGGSAKFLVLAGAVYVMALAVEKLGRLDNASLVKGVLAASVLVAAMAIFAKVTGQKVNVGNSMAMLALAAGLLKMAQVVQEYAEMPWGTFLNGITKSVIVVASLAGVLKIMPPEALPKAMSMVVIAVALKLLAMTIKGFATMPWATYLKGVVLMAGVIGILAGAMYLMNGKGITGAAGLIILAVAINLLVPAIAAFAALGPKKLAIGILGMAAALGVLIGAGYLAAGAGPGLLILSGAILAIGLAVGIAAAGFGLLAIGLTMLAASGVAVVGVIVAAIMGIASTLPFVARQIGTAFIEVVRVLAENMSVIQEFLTKFIQAVLDSLTDSMPNLERLLRAFLDMIFRVVDEYVPKLIDTGFKIIMSLLEGLSENIYKITEKGIEIISEFLRAIGDQGDRLIDEGANTLTKLLHGLADAIRERGDEILKAGADIGLAIVQGMGNAIRDGIGYVKDKAIGLATSVVRGVEERLEVNSPSKVMYDIMSWVPIGAANALVDGVPLVSGASKNLAKAVVTGVSSALQMANDEMHLRFADENFVIKPTVDLTGIEQSARRASGLFNLENTARLASINLGYTQRNPTSMDNSSSGTLGNLVYNQYNYSPRSLSETEIYRQTNNQLSRIKEVLKR